MQMVTHDLPRNYKGNEDVYVSFISDCSIPVIGLVPKDRDINQVLFVIDERNFRYHLKKRGETGNGEVYRSKKMQIPNDFLSYNGSDGVAEELILNAKLNFNYLDGEKL